MTAPKPEIICQFCQKPALYAPIERVEEAGIEVYWCPTCQAEYLLRRGHLKPSVVLCIP